MFHLWVFWFIVFKMQSQIHSWAKNAIKGRQRTRICMKYHLNAFITVNVLGGDSQRAAVVNVGRGTLSGWRLTTPRLVSQTTECYTLSKWCQLSKSISLSTLLSRGRNDAEAETPVLWPPHAKS